MVNTIAITMVAMDTPGDRLRKLREERGLSTRELARDSEGALTYSYISHLERGVAPWSKVSLTILRGLARGLRMPIEDLIAYVDGRAEVEPVADNLVTGRRVPVYDLVSGGDGLDGGLVIDYADIPLKWKGEYVGYEVEGDSMAPRIQSGSTIIVKRTDAVRPGDIIVAYVPEHGMVVKRYAYNEPDGLIVLTSDNPDHEPIFTRELTPLGVVVEVRYSTA